jgi:hypothetical protein
LTVNVWPAIVSVPLRAAPLLADTVYGNDPLPVCDAPLSPVTIHAAPLVADHAQSLALAVTVTDPGPPAARNA